MQKRHKPQRRNKRVNSKTTRKVSKKVSVRRAVRHTVRKQKPQKPHRGSLALRKSAVVVKKVETDLANDAVKVKEADAIISGGIFSEFVLKNVGKQGVELVKTLNVTPHTDDKLAVKMNIKVNEVRRMLNVLNGYGITKYDINKDGKGWLTFKWYLDRDKLSTFYAVLQEKQNSQKVNLQENCNDFFYCASCYKNQKLILPFDSAYELNFKCEGCGKILGVLDKEQANALFASGKPNS